MTMMTLSVLAAAFMALPPSNVAKQLDQIENVLSATSTGMVFGKEHEQVCIDDGMSKHDALDCIEEQLTSTGRNKKPVLDPQAHCMNDARLAHVSTQWDSPLKIHVGLHRFTEREIATGTFKGPGLTNGNKMDADDFTDIAIHKTGKHMTAREHAQLFVMRPIREPLQGSGGDGIDNDDNDYNDDNEQEELEEHEYEPTFDSSAGRTSHEQDEAVMAYVLQLIKQRERLILLTIQAKQGQSEQLQQNKKTATKSLMKCERRQEKYEEQLELLEARLDPAEGEQTSNDEDEESVPTARSTRSSVRTLKNKLNETATQMTTSELQVQAAQDALKITTRDMGLMKNKLLDHRSIQASLIEHAAKLHRWHLQPKIERSSVLKAANEYTKEKNYIPFDEFKKMPKVQRALLWHAAQATLYNLLVQFATANFKYIYNKPKIRQNGKALFDELKKLAVPDTQASKNKSAKKAAAKKAAKSAKKAAAKKAAKRKAKAKAADISSTSDEDAWMGNIYD